MYISFVCREDLTQQCLIFIQNVPLQSRSTHAQVSKCCPHINKDKYHLKLSRGDVVAWWVRHWASMSWVVVSIAAQVRLHSNTLRQGMNP